VVKADGEGPIDGDDELRIEVELAWPENAREDSLSIKYVDEQPAGRSIRK
jgi:hypothetical protein